MTGVGEYVIEADKHTGAAPTPYTPLSIRTREIHMGTASLSTGAARQYRARGLWRLCDRPLCRQRPGRGRGDPFQPGPGLRSRASASAIPRSRFTQGADGAETLAGLTLNIGFDQFRLARTFVFSGRRWRRAADMRPRRSGELRICIRAITARRSSGVRLRRRRQGSRSASASSAASAARTLASDCSKLRG